MIKNSLIQDAKTEYVDNFYLDTCFWAQQSQQNSLCAWWNLAPSDSKMAIFGPWTFAISADRFQKQRQERFSNVSLLQKWKIHVSLSFEIVLIA